MGILYVPHRTSISSLPQLFLKVVGVVKLAGLCEFITFPRVPTKDSRRGRSALRGREDNSDAIELAASTNAGVVETVSLAPTGNSNSGAFEPTVPGEPPSNAGP